MSMRKLARSAGAQITQQRKARGAKGAPVRKLSRPSRELSPSEGRRAAPRVHQ
jgi:hypothetical protein